jgi:PAS domain S-box-containing protein
MKSINRNKYLVDGKYSFKELVAIDRLKDMFEHFSQATGFMTGLVSYPDQELLINTGWRDICTKFHRAYPVSEIHCQQSNLALTANLKERRELNIHHCENGLVDGATPIFIKGVHVANLFTGQILFTEPDIERFRKQAEAYGYDMDTYLEALGKVPVVTEKEFKEALEFLCELAVMIAEQGLTNLQNRETTQTAQESEAKFRALVESSSDWIWEVNREGICTYASPQVEPMLGYKPEEVVGRSMFDLMPPEEATRVAELFKDATGKGEQIVALENINLHKDGRRITLETSGVPVLDEAGKVIGYRGVGRDITERRQAEEELQTMQKLKSLTILAGDIAHDFNNILMGLYGNISLAKEMLSNEHPVSKLFEEAETSMNRATRLTNQLLALAKGGAPVRENVHVGELVSEAPPSTEKHTTRILVMDDDYEIRKVATLMLERTGYSVETASDGKQAIELYRQSLDAGDPFGVVIMDLTIPGGTGGKEAVKDILEIDPEAKVIVSSGHPDNHVIANYAEYGFKGIAIKPYSISKLREAVSQVIKESGPR